jgi:peroxiredoxin family protein
VVKEGAGNNKTLIVFSDDLDKALASFVIANGAASTGRKVTMFFTFWGLNVIRKERADAVKKDTMGKMFGMMMPAGSRKLSLSKMNMMGMGTRMMRKVMRNKQIDSLESLIEQARNNGVEFIACQMSMDVMGIAKEELIDGVNVGGVATYLERAEDANVNLFV